MKPTRSDNSGEPLEAPVQLSQADQMWLAAYYAGTGQKQLHLWWAKMEIALGLAAAAGGLRLLLGVGAEGWAGGGLFVLGTYLAMAGNRSHLYISLNRQAAYLLQMLVEGNGASLENAARGPDAPKGD